MSKKEPIVIDITKIIEKKKMISELVEGIDLIVNEDNEQDFKFLLKGYLEKDYHYDVSYNRDEDLMTIRDVEGLHVCNVTFTSSKVFVLLPPDYMGSSMEKSSVGHCYKLVSTFCSTWNKLGQESQ